MKGCYNCWFKERVNEQYCAECMAIFKRTAEDEKVSRKNYPKTWAYHDKFGKHPAWNKDWVEEKKSTDD